MRCIGLLGGMSFEGSTVYYRLINEAVRHRLGGLHSAELLMHSVDFQTIVGFQKTGDWQAAGELLARNAQRLQRAGAEAVLVCAVTMHKVAPQIEEAIDVPFLHIVDATADRLIDAGCRRPLLLATRYTMEGDFYPARMQRYGIEIMVPDAAGRDLTHGIIFEELCAGKLLHRSRQALNDLVSAAARQGADSVILGCTELCLILDPARLPLPGFDSTQIHADAAVAFALGG